MKCVNETCRKDIPEKESECPHCGMTQSSKPPSPKNKNYVNFNVSIM
jgi:hypothetical protein